MFVLDDCQRDKVLKLLKLWDCAHNYGMHRTSKELKRLANPLLIDCIKSKHIDSLKHVKQIDQVASYEIS